MEDPYLLHMLDPGRNASPFDINMAYDAGWDAVTPYTGVAHDDVPGLVQDAIFSRSPKLGARTGIFIGGRDANLAKDMGEAAWSARVPPFEVSVMVDPSGAFTTAAALIARVEAQLAADDDRGLAQRRVVILGGSGPVGSTTGVLAAWAGADVVMATHRDLAAMEALSRELAERHGVTLSAGEAGSEAQKAELLAEAEVVLNCAAAGVQVLTGEQLAKARHLRVAADVNVVPPAGLEGVDVQDAAKPLEGAVSGAVGIGALAVGQLKSRVEHNLLGRMRDSEEAVYLHYDQALQEARGLAG